MKTGTRRIIISINPKYVVSILDGSKKFEYRTRVCKEDVRSIIIYETYPVKLIVAEAKVLGIIALPPKEMWNQTHKHGGINKEDFDNYFKGREIAYAYKLGKITIFKDGLDIKTFGLRSAPQSFAYAR